MSIYNSKNNETVEPTFWSCFGLFSCHKKVDTILERTPLLNEHSLVDGADKPSLDGRSFTVEPCDPFQGVQEISQDLYLGKKKKDLYFVMERVDDQTVDFWRSYGNYQFQVQKDLRNTHPDIYSKNEDVIEGFYLGFKGYNASFNIKSEAPYELWIVYASYVPVKKRGQVHWDNIEMACTVLTSVDAPFVTHMGIARSMTSYRDKKPMHKEISLNVHSFAAKVMKIRYSHKQYMITVPLPVMKGILARALPGQVYIGDTAYKDSLENIVQGDERKIGYEDVKIDAERAQELLKEYENNSLNVIEKECSMKTFRDRQHEILERFSLRDKLGEIIFSVDKKDIKDYSWFFHHTCMQPSRTMPYVTVDYDALASKLVLPQPESGITSLISSLWK